MALRGRKIENVDDVSLAAGSQELPICVSSTNFQKSSIGWPQQHPTEMVSDISKKLDFWWSIPQKVTIIGHFGAKNDPSVLVIFLMKWGSRGHWGCRGSKAWKSQLGSWESSRFLNSMILMFWKKNWGVESWNIKLNFSTFSVRDCWGQPMLLFWKLVD